MAKRAPATQPRWLVASFATLPRLGMIRLRVSADILFTSFFVLMNRHNFSPQKLSGESYQDGVGLQSWPRASVVELPALAWPFMMLVRWQSHFHFTSTSLTA